MKTATMTRKDTDEQSGQDAGHQGRIAKPKRTHVMVRVEDEILAAIDAEAIKERRYERGPMINVLLREALTGRGYKLK